MYQPVSTLLLSKQYTPSAYAILRGNYQNTDIQGVANFYANPVSIGLLIEIEVAFLPPIPSDCPTFLGLHIHEYGDCSENFSQTGMHYNPENKTHPCHLGDLPPLLNNNGYAYLCFYDSFLYLSEILFRSIVIHSQKDDFTSEPSGDSGEKIACGLIKPFP